MLSSVNIANDSSRLFVIAELVEQILLHLPIHEFLRAQLVSRFFRDVIRDSRLIQQALFLQPLNMVTEEHLKLVEVHDADTGANALPPGLPHKMPVNPFLGKYLRYQQTSLAASFGGRTWPFSAFSKFIRTPRTASCRKMLVLQPHAAHILVDDGLELKTRREIRDGLRLCDVMEMQEKINQRFIWSQVAASSAPVWIELYGLQWDWRLCGERASHVEGKQGQGREVSGWQVLHEVVDTMME